jgi:hypothetical protein
MANRALIPEAVLYTQAVLLAGVGLFAIIAPEDFLAGTSDKIAGKPTQLLHSIGYNLAFSATTLCTG